MDIYLDSIYALTVREIFFMLQYPQPAIFGECERRICTSYQYWISTINIFIQYKVKNKGGTVQLRHPFVQSYEQKGAFFV